MSTVSDESGDDTAGVDVSRRSWASELGAAIVIVSSISSAVVGWYLADLFGQCGSESFGWISLLVGACFLALAIGTAIVCRTAMGTTLMNVLVWVIVVCALPLIVAVVLWLDTWSGCSD